MLSAKGSGDGTGRGVGVIYLMHHGDLPPLVGEVPHCVPTIQ